ncbi:MAG: HAMP domain-containing histidine kinase [Flavobacteriaceae bacterium]|uniref:sensor histidine kinase n=1 Tax=Flagellimonas TaxID=444459 RepID=UPI0025CF864A|nr:HAMP domain-containing sensor histidine kinase [Allomuricauda sp.]MCR9263373.1 HAMP domain-containing histidine kinase [Flavobacteriaceae bacterium]
MHTAEEKLRERIKELTCLYEVTSLIVNCDYEQIEEVLRAIAHCLQRAWQYDADALVELQTSSLNIKTDEEMGKCVFLQSSIKVFNEQEGYIRVGYPSSKYTQSDFLIEEQRLLDNVCLEVGNLLERKEIKENQVDIRRQVEQADRLRILGEITAGIAHELNTPLANILGFAELLRERIEGDSDAEKDLDKIISNAIFSREVVKKLMFFACEMPQERASVNIVPIIKDAIDLLRTTLSRNEVSCELEVGQEDITLKIDKIQLTQVLFNLIVNALYFSPPKGKIVVAVCEHKETVVLKISDEGVGIPLDIANKVFDPFFTTKPVGEGSGLGLSVVHGIVKSHQGTIKHMPNSPSGTIFTIEFPKL